MALNQAFPLVYFYQICVYCFNGMGMEYSLRRHFGVRGCGWVDRVLDWETSEPGLFPGVLLFKIFFLFF